MTNQSVGVKHLSTPLQTLIALLTVLAIVVPCVLGFVNFDKRVDIVENDVTKLEVDVEENVDDINAMQLNDAVQSTQYSEILRRIEEVSSVVKNLERVD